MKLVVVGRVRRARNREKVLDMRFQDQQRLAVKTLVMIEHGDRMLELGDQGRLLLRQAHQVAKHARRHSVAFRDGRRLRGRPIHAITRHRRGNGEAR